MEQRTLSFDSRLTALAATLALMASLAFAGLNFINSAHAAGEGTATIDVGIDGLFGTDASNAIYGGPGAAGTVVVGQKSYLKIDLTLGANITANEANVTFDINNNLFPPNGWDPNFKGALNNVVNPGDWFIGYTDTGGATDNSSIDFIGSGSDADGFLILSASEQMDAGDIITIYAAVRDTYDPLNNQLFNGYDLPAAPMVISTDNSGANELTPIGLSPTIATVAHDAAASIGLAGNSVVGGTGDTTLILSLPYALTAGNSIGITFPPSVDVSGVGDEVTGSLENGGESLCSNAPMSQTVRCVVGAMTTTLAAGGTLILTDIETLYADTSNVDVGVETTFGSADYIASDLGAPMTDIEAADADATVGLGANSVVGTSGEVTLELTVPYVLTEGNSIGMTFPDSFDVSGVDAAVTGDFEDVGQISCSNAPMSQTVRCVVQAMATTATTGTLVLTGIETLYADTSNVDVGVETAFGNAEYIALSLNAPTDAITAADAAASIVLESPAIGGVGNTVLTLTLPAGLVLNDTIDITFPAHINVTSAAFSSDTFPVGTFSACNDSCQVVTCIAAGAVDAATATITMTGITATASGTADASVEVEYAGGASNDIATDNTVALTDTPPAPVAPIFVPPHPVAPGGRDDSDPCIGLSSAECQAKKDPQSVIQKLAPLTPVPADAAQAACSRTGELPFTDVSGAVKDDVSKLYFLCVIDGISPTLFGPSLKMNRAVIVKLAMKAFGHDAPSVSVNPFIDVLFGAWYAPYVSAAKALGIVRGLDGGSLFEPDRSVYLAEALQVFFEAAGMEASAAKAVFSDVPTAAWFAGYATLAYEKGIITPDANGNLNPAKALSRADTVSLLVKIMEMK